MHMLGGNFHNRLIAFDRPAILSFLFALIFTIFHWFALGSDFIYSVDPFQHRVFLQRQTDFID